uniref:Ig-like domain-containing protein n=1 Tax=Panagrellus redivivus TaxID=6233 RepID=A0A7E4VDG7_PANRE
MLKPKLAIFYLLILLVSLTEPYGYDYGCPEECTCFDDTVSCVRLNLSYPPRGVPSSTKVLLLSENSISDFPISLAAQLPNLTHLNLSNNHISSIPFELFSYIPKLKQLELRDNGLRSIPSGIHQLSMLERLDLRLNLISTITEEDLYGIAHVKYIDLGRNRIKQWPILTPSNFTSSRIIFMDLGNNDIEVLPVGAFRALQRLAFLRLHRNKLSRIENDSFGRAIMTLDLSRNRIEIINTLCFSTLYNLESLTLSRNLITSLQAGAFHGINNLKYLNLSHNRLTDIGDGLFGQGALIKLDLSSNDFTYVNDNMWSFVENLDWLSLARNRISELSSYAFRPLRSLTYLSLSHNLLSHIGRKTLVGLNTLVEIDLSHNELAVCIEDGTVLQNTSLKSLETLHFSANRVGSVPPHAFSGFPNLRHLDLSDNPISMIFKGAFDPLRLDTLKITTPMLICDCHLTWFSAWLKNSGLGSRDIVTLCEYPFNVRGKDIRSFETGQLKCLADSPQARITMSPLPLVDTQVGRDVRMFCKGYGAAPMHIKWKVIESERDRVLEDEEGTLRIVVNHTDDEGHRKNEFIFSELLLRNVSVSDQAEYQCIIKNSYGSAYSIKSQLLVKEPPRFTVKPPVNIAVLAGSTVTLPCEATGIPEPTISYQKDRHYDFPAWLEDRIHVADRVEGLHLLRVNREDEGTYECVASNEIGEAVAKSHIHVFDHGLTSTLYNATVQVKTPLVMFCRGSGSVPYEIRWYFNGTRVAPNNNLNIEVKGDNDEMLVVSETEYYHTGLYVCEMRVTKKNYLLQVQFSEITIAEYVEEEQFAYELHSTTVPSITDHKWPKDFKPVPDHPISVNPFDPDYGFFKIVITAFKREYNQWNYKMQIGFILLSVFLLIAIVTCCCCCLRIFYIYLFGRNLNTVNSVPLQRERESRAAYVQHAQGNYITRVHHYYEQTYTPSTNSSTCTTYATITPSSTHDAHRKTVFDSIRLE